MKIFRQFLSSLLITLILLFQGMVYPIIPFITPAHAAISSSFTATQITANQSATNDQTAVTATTTANVVAGTNDQTFTLANVTPNTAAVAQVNTITITGTVETGDIFTATLPTVGAVNYTVQVTDTTTDNIATGLNSAIQASTGYASQAFTSAVNTNVITLTAKVAGTGFTVTSGATDVGGTNDQNATSATTQANVVAVAQVDDITPANIEVGDVFTVSGVSTSPVSVTATDTSAATLVNALVSAVNSAGGVTVTASNSSDKLRLTANSAGTAFTATPSTTNRAAVAQVNTITIGGTVETGDVFTATLPTVGAVNYTVQGGDTTTANIASGLNTAIQNSTDYASQAFTSGVSGSVVTLTAKVAGTGFTQTSGTTNRATIAQVVDFTPASVTAGETFKATMNGTNYTYLAATGNTVQTVVEALQPLMDANGAVTCTEDDTKVRCTADSAGTSFSYAATVEDVTSPTAFTTGAVTATGGTVVSGKWNSTNTGVNVTVPVANDPTLTGGTIQLQSARDGSTFSNVGDPYTILVGNLGGNATVSLTAAQFEGITSFADGDTITLRARMTDSNGLSTNGSASSTTISVDQATPTFTASRTASGTVTLTFNEAVSASDTSTTAWTVSGATVTAASQPSSSTSMTLTVTGLSGTSETPTVTYVASNGTVLDASGNEVADGANAVASDALAPTLAEVTAISALTNDTTPDYTFSSTEAGTITYGGSCASGTTSASAGNNTVTFNTLSDGTYGSCTVRVTDSASNQSTLLSVSSFTVDATAPSSPSISTVATDNRVNSSEKSAIVVAGTAEANSFVTVTITDSASTVKTGTQQLSGGGTSYSITIDGTTTTALVDGNLSVSATARDAANNTSSAGTATVPLDTSAPSAPSTPDLDSADDTGSSSTDNTTKNTSSLTITGTAESGSTVELFNGAVSLGTTTATGGNWSFEISLSEGTHSITAKATDTAGNVSSASSTLSVTVDTTNPTGTFTINNDAAYTNSTSVSLTFSSVSSDVNVLELKNAIGGGSFQSPVTYSNPYSYTLPSTDGLKEMSARFTDTAGNVSSTVTDTITLDTTNPVISGVTLTNNTTSNNTYVKNGDSVTLTATVSDTNQGSITTSNIFANLSSLGGGTAVNPTGYNTSTGVATWAAITVSGTSEANVTVTVDATDPATNAATQGSATMNGNNSTPVPTADSATTTKNTALNITASTLVTNDTDAGGDSLSVTAVSSPSNGTVSLTSGTITFTPTTNYLGSASFTYTVSDGSLSATGTVNITVNPPVSSGQTLLQTTQTVDTSSPQIVVGAQTADSTITIPATVTNASLDLSNLVTTSGSNNNVTLTNAITLNSTISSVGDVDVAIPAGVTITGASGSWSGTLYAPQVRANSTVTPPAPSEGTAVVTSVVEVGFDDVALTFDKGVRIVLEGYKSSLVGYSRGGVFTPITNTCSADTQTAGDALPSGGDCKIVVGNDMVIWTKHFTKFVAYFNATPHTVLQPNSPSAPSCNDPRVGGAPTLLSATSNGSNQVSLVWSKALDPVTHYVVSYGLESGKPLYGNPNVGNVSSYTVNNLSGGTTYYFRVRGGNGCNGGDYSNEIAVSVGGPSISGPASGFIPGVLGVSSQNVGVGEEVQVEEVTPGEVQGTNSEVSKSEGVNFQPQTQKSGGLFASIGKFFGSIFGMIFGIFSR